MTQMISTLKSFAPPRLDTYYQESDFVFVNQLHVTPYSTYTEECGKTMGYDGNPSKSTCDDGFHVAEEIIKRCETLLR